MDLVLGLQKRPKYTWKKHSPTTQHLMPPDSLLGCYRVATTHNPQEMTYAFSLLLFYFSSFVFPGFLANLSTLFLLRALCSPFNFTAPLLLLPDHSALRN